MRRIYFWWRWLKWFLSGPKEIDGYVGLKLDKPTRDILFTRWLDREPKK